MLTSASSGMSKRSTCASNLISVAQKQETELFQIRVLTEA